MAEPADFLTYVLPFAQACPNPVAERFILEAADEFCRRTRLWRHVQETKTKGVVHETLLMPPEASLYQITGLWFDGNRLEPVGYGQVLDDTGEIGQPRYFSQIGPDHLQLIPRGIGDMRVEMVLKPQHDAENLPDFLLEHHAKLIGYGALREIFLLQNQPFTSPDMAALYAQRFEAGLNELFALNLRGQHRAPVRTRPNYF